MPDLSTMDIIGYASGALLVLTLAFEVLRRLRRNAPRDVSPTAFLGLTLAAAGFAVYCSLRQDVLFTVTSAATATIGFGGFILAVAERKIWGTNAYRPSRPSRDARSFSILVRTGERLDTSRDLARALERMRRTAP